MRWEMKLETLSLIQVPSISLPLYSQIGNSPQENIPHAAKCLAEAEPLFEIPPD